MTPASFPERCGNLRFSKTENIGLFRGMLFFLYKRISNVGIGKDGSVTGF
jgi:hypothetical protein